MKKITPILFVLVLLLALTSCDDGVQFCTVTFKAEDGSTYLTQTVAKNAKVSNIEGPKKEGTWSFDCWLEEKTGVRFDFDKAVNEDTSLIPSYVNGYKVTFDSNGGTAVAAQFIEEGMTVIEPKDPTNGTVTFKYWVKLKTDGRPETEAYDFSQPVTSSFTLKAIYNDIYTVTFIHTDGSKALDDQQVLEGTVLTRPTDPSLDDASKVFVKWNRIYDDEDRTVEYYDFTEPVTSDLKLVAVFDDVSTPSAPKTYTITFDVNGASSTSATYGDQTITSGDKVSRPENPTKDGYTFKYWVKVMGGKESSTAYNFNEPVTESFQLKAVYENVYTVTFDSDGGTYTPEPQKVENGQKASEPKAPDKESTRGFMWWAKASSINQYGDSEPYDFDEPVTSDLTLKAVYWPANLRSGDYSVYDNAMYAKYDEVENQHYIIKKLVNTDALMNDGKDVTTVFNVSDSTNNPLVLSLFTYAKMTPDKVKFSNGPEVDISDSNLTYDIKLNICSIESNTTQKKYNDFTESTKYTVNITNLKLNIYFHYYDSGSEKDYKESQEVEISLKGTFLKNSEDRYELHMKMTIDGKEYPVLHASAITSPVSAGRSDYDNVLCFSYDGFSSYITIDTLW